MKIQQHKAGSESGIVILVAVGFLAVCMGLLVLAYHGKWNRDNPGFKIEQHGK